MDPFTGLPIEEDPLLEYHTVYNTITRLHLQIIALRNHLLLNVIPRLAIQKEGAEIDAIAKELLNWD